MMKQRAVLIISALFGAASIAACGNGGGKGDPTPTPDPTSYEGEAWTSATASFVGTNNPNDNALCVNGGPTDVSTWTGSATVNVEGGGSLVLGDPSDTNNNVVAAECLDSSGDCLTSGSPDECLFLFFSATKANTPEQNHQENLLYIIVPDPATDWTSGATIVLGTPITDGTQPYAYGLTAIDNNFNNKIDTDSNGDPIAPDTEVNTGITLDGTGGAFDLGDAGVNDGEAVSIDGDATITLSPIPQAAQPAIDPSTRAAMRRLAQRARDMVAD